MFFAVLGAGAFFYIYHIFIGRYLGAAAYGEFGALFSLSYYLQFILFKALNVMIARSVSKFKGQNNTTLIKLFHKKMFFYMLIIGFTAFVIFSALSWHIADFLHIDSIILILFVGIIFFICWILPVNCGTIQGLQRFNHLALMNFLPAVLKFLIGAGLVLLGFGIYGAIGGLALGIFVNLLISFYLLRDILNWKLLTRSTKIQLKNKETIKSNSKEVHLTTHDINIEIKDALRFSFPVILMVSCIAIPSNIDVILVKHFFTSLDAGLFTAVTVFGKMILVVPLSITSVMYPKIIEANVKKIKTNDLLKRSLVYTSIPAGIAALIFFLFPTTIIGIFYGEEYIGAEILLKYYGIFIFFFSIASVFVYNSLANNRFGYVYIFVIFSIIEIGLIWLYHHTLISIIQILLIISILLVVVGFVKNLSYHDLKIKT